MLLELCAVVGSPEIKLTIPLTKLHDHLLPRSSFCASAAFPKLPPRCPHWGKKVFPLCASFSSFTGTSTSSPKSNIRKRIEASYAISKQRPFIYPELTSKPRWWWRTLACIPYLMPLHNVWSYADVIYQLHPFLENLEFLANPFLDTMALMPNWLVLVCFMCIYFFVVRRREWPHFLRFHVVMAMLLDTGFQAGATACTWIPGMVYRSKVMAYFWMAVAFSLFSTIVECMRCALVGMYPDVPFISDTAFIHCDPNLLKF